MCNFLGYFQTGTIGKWFLAVPKSSYPDGYGNSMKDDSDSSLTPQNTSFKYTSIYKKFDSSSALVIPEEKNQGLLAIRTADSTNILPLPVLLGKNMKRKVSDTFPIN